MRQIFDNVAPGYKMNKDTWDTIVISDSDGESELFFTIKHCYELVRPRLREHDKTITTRGKPWPVNFYCSVFGLLGESYPDMPKDAEKAVEFILEYKLNRFFRVFRHIGIRFA